MFLSEVTDWLKDRLGVAGVKYKKCKKINDKWNKLLEYSKNLEP